MLHLRLVVEGDDGQAGVVNLLQNKTLKGLVMIRLKRQTERHGLGGGGVRKRYNTSFPQINIYPAVVA